MAVAGGLRVLAGWRTAGGELGFQAVEDDLDAELEAAVGCRGVVGGGCSEAGAQPRKLRRDLAGLGHAGAYELMGVTAVAAELAGERGRGGQAEGVAEHVGEDGGRCLVGLGGRESGGLVDGEVSRTWQWRRPRDLFHAGLPCPARQPHPASSESRQRAPHRNQPAHSGSHNATSSATSKLFRQAKTAFGGDLGLQDGRRCLVKVLG